MKNISEKVIGLILVIIGVGYIGDICNAWEFSIFFNGWWTLFIIVPAFISILENGPKISNVSFAIFGLLLLLSRSGIVDISYLFRYIVPILLVLWGLKLIFGKKKVYRDSHFDQEAYKSKQYTGTSDICEVLYFSTRHITHKGNLNSCRGESIIGTLTLDLRDADLHNMAFFNLEAFVGSVNVIVNEDVLVELSKDNAFGSCKNEAVTGSYTVRISASSVFGYIHIMQRASNDPIYEGEFEEN